MAIVSQFVPQQFIDAASLSNLAININSNGTAFQQTQYHGGLVNPHSASFSSSGLVAVLTFTYPYGIAFPNGVVANAHGVTSGADTQVYNVDLTSLVPSVSASPVTVQFLASYIGIQQNQYALIGPPPGHPDFNPNFQPSLAYSYLTDSFAVSASTGLADNNATFEVCRTTIQPAATALGTFDTTFIQRSADRYHYTVVPYAGSGLTDLTAGSLNLLTQSPQVYTLPLTSAAAGQSFWLVNSPGGSGLVIIQADGTRPDLIYGTYPNPARGAPAIILDQGTSATLVAASGFWQVISGQPRSTMFRAQLASPLSLYVSATGSDSNSGLGSTVSFATIQHALDIAAGQYDFGMGNSITVYVGAGTFAGGTARLAAAVGGGANAQVIVSGVGTTTLITDTSPSSDCFNVGFGALLQVNNLRVRSSAGHGFTTHSGGRIVFNNVFFDVCLLGHMYTYNNATITLLTSGGTYSVVGSGAFHAFGTMGGVVDISSASGVIVSGIPNFTTAFAVATDGGKINAGGVTFAAGTSAASGIRFLASTGGIIDTGSAGATGFFPGTASGTATSGTFGLYI